MVNIMGQESQNLLNDLGKRACVAKYELQMLTETKKNEALTIIALQLVKDTKKIIAANQKDLALAKENGMHPGLIDRLMLNKDRIKAIADGLLQITRLKDPIGEVLETIKRPNKLVIKKKRVPLGVIGIIYESRPNVTADAFGLCFKTGNAVILKGGSDALYSNKAICESIQEGLGFAKITQDAILLIEDTNRETTKEFMRLKEYVDILIPRGGAGLIRAVVENSTIPVIETGTGNCHIYVEQSADLVQSISIIVNAKTQRIGVCNACESLVIDELIMNEFLPMLKKSMDEHGVELRVDEKAKTILKDEILATEEDFAMEYLDKIISVKIVSGVVEAIEHINRYNTKHSDAILSKDKKAIEQFLNCVDSACVYANASTRFTDGFEFGFGAEIGISTQKLHARGPMGLKELTSYKYTIEGNGQVRP